MVCFKLDSDAEQFSRVRDFACLCACVYVCVCVRERETESERERERGGGCYSGHG